MDHMGVTAGVASVDTPRPHTFLVSDAGWNSLVFAGGQYDSRPTDRAALAANSVIISE